MTSAMDSPRRLRAELSPITQRTASMMLDLPQPLGPTTALRLLGKVTVVGSTKDLKPASLMDLSRMESGLARCPESCGNHPGKSVNPALAAAQSSAFGSPALAGWRPPRRHARPATEPGGSRCARQARAISGSGEPPLQPARGSVSDCWPRDLPRRPGPDRCG